MRDNFHSFPAFNVSVSGNEGTNTKPAINKKIGFVVRRIKSN